MHFAGSVVNKVKGGKIGTENLFLRGTSNPRIFFKLGGVPSNRKQFRRGGLATEKKEKKLP